MTAKILINIFVKNYPLNTCFVQLAMYYLSKKNSYATCAFALNMIRVEEFFLHTINI